jgi:pteridine reductase
MTRTAVVTGGARRIGRVIATHLHAAGYDIALHCRSSLEEARALAAILNQKRTQSCRVYQADLEDLRAVQSMCEQIMIDSGAVALLVNNASGFSATPIQSCTPADFDRMMASNLKGPYFIIQYLLPAMSEGACIVNMLDIHIDRPLRDFNAYGAAKAGLAALTRSLAVELGPAVRVNGVAPGAILWPQDDEAYDQTTRERTIAATPMKRLGDPDDIARTVAFLAEDAPFITGQVITVDGGRHLTHD